MDDFGAGYSSLSYLRDLPIDVLKIDRSFLSSFDPDDLKHDFTAGVIKLVHRLGLRNCAEGVEEERQRAGLRALGCELGQGYLFAKPFEASQFEEWLTAATADATSRQHRNA